MNKYEKKKFFEKFYARRQYNDKGPVQNVQVLRG